MIKIHQIQLTDAEIDMVNEKGHNSVEANRISLDLSFDGAKAWKPEMFRFFDEAYEVNTDSLEEAFALTNHWQDQSKIEVIGDRNHSSSCGDIFEKDGKFFIVEHFGFKEIEVMTEYTMAAIEGKTEEAPKKVAKKGTKKAIVANIVNELGVQNRKAVIAEIMNVLGVTKANAGVYLYNFKKAQ